MKTLLLRLAAPLQSWGISSGFETRTTDRYPSKSGVIGLLSAALGRRRDADINDLMMLHFGVRVDQEGHLLRDYHTARGKKASYVTNRYYLSDAVFLVGVSSEQEDFLGVLEKALHYPAYPLYLGRRSNPPTGQMVLGIRDGNLFEVLKDEPWQAAEWYKKKWKQNRPEETPELRIITESDIYDTNSAIVRDQPRSYSPYRREYDFRSITDHGYQTVERQEHDPFSELEE